MRDMILVLIGVIIAESLQGLNNALNALIYHGESTTTYAITQIAIFVFFLFFTYVLVRMFENVSSRDDET